MQAYIDDTDLAPIERMLEDFRSMRGDETPFDASQSARTTFSALLTTVNHKFNECTQVNPRLRTDGVDSVPKTNLTATCFLSTKIITTINAALEDIRQIRARLIDPKETVATEYDAVENALVIGLQDAMCLDILLGDLKKESGQHEYLDMTYMGELEKRRRCSCFGL